MPDLLPSVDPAKSYMVSGETLNALIANANQFANLTVRVGASLDLIRGEGSAVLTIPTITPTETMYGEFRSCDGLSCSSAQFLIVPGTAGT